MLNGSAAAEAELIEDLNPARPELFRDDTHWPYFRRLRAEAPVHLTRSSAYGPYWSITKFNDIALVAADHETFSSRCGTSIADRTEDALQFPMFIASDPPDHALQRSLVSSAFSSARLRSLEPAIRAHVSTILDHLPIGEPFDWVPEVSKKVTAMTLGLLLGMPEEDRAMLGAWSDAMTRTPGNGGVPAGNHQGQVLSECYAYFSALWVKRAGSPAGDDLVSRLAHAEKEGRLSVAQLIGNLILLIVGGSDSTRNSMSASVLALHHFPDQREALNRDPGLSAALASETVRWQSPIAHTMRITTRDIELKGRYLRRGDRVALWYVSGNRDEEVINEPDQFVLNRPPPRLSIAFGSGAHHCIGRRLAELQLSVLWQEVIKRFAEIEVLAEPQRVFSTFARGYTSMTVQIKRRAF